MLIRCLELHVCLCSWSVIRWSGEAGCSCTMPFPTVITMNNAYYVNVILNIVSLFLTKKWDELTALMLIRALLSTYLFLFQGDSTAARKNCHNDSETNPLFVPLTYIPKKKATHLEGRDTTTTTKKYTSVMIRVCHSRSRFLSCMYIHDDFMTESR